MTDFEFLQWELDFLLDLRTRLKSRVKLTKPPQAELVMYEQLTESDPEPPRLEYQDWQDCLDITNDCIEMAKTKLRRLMS